MNPTEQTILIVDDTPTNLGVIADYLEDYGFDIVTALDGEEGLQRAVQVKPNIILLDVMMPGIDGFETCRRLRANEVTQDIPVIFMTALTQTEDKVKAFSSGAVDYVTKPVQQAEVLARIQAHLTIQQQKEELEELRQREAERAEALAALNASRERFFSIVAHDLRTPFNPLLGMSQVLMMMDDLPEDASEMASYIYHAARSTYDLLENLLQWSMIEGGHLTYKPERIQVSEVAEEVVSLLKETATAKKIGLESEVAEDIWVEGDRNMVATVLRNLVSNALKFTLAEGEVVITAGLGLGSDEMVEIRVKDTGIGMTIDEQAQLFQQVGGNTRKGTANEKGAGIGLIICQEMVERWGGEIGVRSEVGQGTVMTFTLPRAVKE
ncbi:MAG TPA: hybrid sensor histidine kinase/response regulator [Anaerolineae bacterium]|nr:hybrid sensor histidine kinase/response regulator [Anaerolineae bacterium]